MQKSIVMAGAIAGALFLAGCQEQTGAEQSGGDTSAPTEQQDQPATNN